MVKTFKGHFTLNASSYFFLAPSFYMKMQGWWIISSNWNMNSHKIFQMYLWCFESHKETSSFIIFEKRQTSILQISPKLDNYTTKLVINNNSGKI